MIYKYTSHRRYATRPLANSVAFIEVTEFTEFFNLTFSYTIMRGYFGRESLAHQPQCEPCEALNVSGMCKECVRNVWRRCIVSTLCQECVSTSDKVLNCVESVHCVAVLYVLCQPHSDFS